MKKLIIGILILFLIIRCNLFYTKDEAKFIVTDFSKKRIDTLMPYKGETYIGGYVTYIIRVKGYTNDSIKIEREGYYDIILSGQIDTLMNGDYYGGEDVIYTFNPYKATKGELEIEYDL